MTVNKKRTPKPNKTKVSTALPLIVMLCDKIRFRLKGTRTTIPSDKLIKEWKSLPEIEHDRDLNKNRMEKLEHDLQRGFFKTANWIKVYCKATKKWYRANGQHTSSLFIRTPKHILKQLRVVIESYEVDELSDVAALLSRIDARNSVKSPSDIYGYYASITNALNSLTKTNRNLCAGGLRFGVLDDFLWRASIEDIAKLVVREAKFCLWFQKFAKDVSPPGGFNAATVGSLFVAYKHVKSRSKAKEFWTKVCVGNTVFTSPAGRLREFLLSHGLGGRTLYSNKIQVSSRMMFDTANLMFEHYRRGVTDVPQLTVKEINTRLAEKAKPVVQKITKAKKPIVKSRSRAKV